MKTYENHWTPFKAIDFCRPLRWNRSPSRPFATCPSSPAGRRSLHVHLGWGLRESGGINGLVSGNSEHRIFHRFFPIFLVGKIGKSGFKIVQNHPILWGVGRGKIPRIHRRKWAFSWILLVISPNSKGVETVIWSWKIFRKDSSVGDQKISKEKEHTTGGDGDIIVFPPWSSKIWALTNLNEALFFYNRPFFRFSINGRFTATYM